MMEFSQCFHCLIYTRIEQWGDETMERKNLHGLGKLTLAPPRSMVETQKITWTTAKTNMKICRWCNASKDSNGTLPLLAQFLGPLSSSESSLLLPFHSHGIMISECWLVISCCLHGSMMVAAFSGIHIWLTTFWATVNKSDMNPSTINSACNIHTLLILSSLFRDKNHYLFFAASNIR